MKKNEFKIKVIEKPMMNFGNVEKLTKKELSELQGGTEADDKHCVLIFDTFWIGPICVCRKKYFLANSEDVVA
ncbi:MAG: hypothetical protein LBS69_12560 [Prevotellaceae bacterium]|jgi:hypothetical protein|nr:hypothetical protein [Prevotellaceae bacterium]